MLCVYNFRRLFLAELVADGHSVENETMTGEIGSPNKTIAINLD